MRDRLSTASLGPRPGLAVLCILGLLTLAGCQAREGEVRPNQPPLTAVTARDFTVGPDGRLLSTVRLLWSGTDPDGFVVGYQIAIGESETWSRVVPRTDSLFRFRFQTGTDTARIRFRVRAVDNLGLADPNPAELILPVRNSPPVARLEAGLGPRSDTALVVLTFGLTVSDPDGIETLDSVFVVINDGRPVALPRQTTTFSLVPERPGQPGPGPALIYRGSDRTPWPVRAQGLVVGGTNRIRIFARDISQASSDTVFLAGPTGQEREYYLRTRTADLLVVGSHLQRVEPRPMAVYGPALSQVVPGGYDYLDLYANRYAAQPTQLGVTLPLLLASYGRVFWFSDDFASGNRADTTIRLMEAVAPIMAGYLAGGGRMLLSAIFQNRLPKSSTVYGLLPVDSISDASALARLSRGVTLPARAAGFPDLRLLDQSQGGRILTGVDIFHRSSDGQVLYEAPVTSVADTEPRTIAVRRERPGTGRADLIFMALELHLASGDQWAFRQFLDRALNQDLAP